MSYTINDPSNIIRILTGAEDKSGAIAVLDLEHHEIHKGNYYYSDYYQAVLAGSGGVIVWGIDTGAHSVHLKPTNLNVPDSNNVTIEFYEEAEYTDGTPLVITNRNYNSTNETAVSQVIAPTVEDNGNLKRSFRLLGISGQGNTRQGGRLGTEQEYVLKPDTKYLVRIVNNDSVATRITLGSEWYEVDISGA